jgi:transcriptional regulator with XRE-family HTH domain/predicted Rdx family selenoprotein
MTTLKELRLLKKLTQATLAEKVGTSQPQIRRLEQGERRMTTEWAEKLAPHLGVDPVDLLFPDRLKKPKPAPVVTPPAPSIDPEDGVLPDIMPDSLQEDAPSDSALSEGAVGGSLMIRGDVAAGLWMEAGLFEAETVGESTLTGGDRRFPLGLQYLLRIKGESMNRIARDGDLVLCLDYAGAGNEIRSGDMVIVERSRDGGHTIERTAKRAVRHVGGVELHPESDDPRFQEPIIFDEYSEEASEVRILAKVLSVIRQIE